VPIPLPLIIYLTLMTDNNNNNNRQEPHLIDLNIKGSATRHHVTKHYSNTTTPHYQYIRPQKLRTPVHHLDCMQLTSMKSKSRLALNKSETRQRK